MGRAACGARLPYTQVQALPWRDGRARLAERCAPGQCGVIVVQGPHVSPGYSDEARNAGVFEGGWLVSRTRRWRYAPWSVRPTRMLAKAGVQTAPALGPGLRRDDGHDEFSDGPRQVTHQLRICA